MSSYICLERPVVSRCYATMWSYGVICVRCGCCGKPSIDRDKARLEYWQDELNRCVDFKCWSDYPELRLIQEANILDSLRRARRMTIYYSKKLEVNDE